MRLNFALRRQFRSAA